MVGAQLKTTHLGDPQTLQLWRGARAGISKMDVSVDLGGTYLTPDMEVAKKYAILSGKEQFFEPAVYECRVEDVRIANLKDPEVLVRIMRGFRVMLSEFIENPDKEQKYIFDGQVTDSEAKLAVGYYASFRGVSHDRSQMAIQTRARQCVEAIDRGLDGVVNGGAVFTDSVRLFTEYFFLAFNKYLADLGFDGLRRRDYGPVLKCEFDTIIIFNPNRVTILREVNPESLLRSQN
jgi:hypothetical protein